ncbi:hypothetical protein [Mesorhizobium sp. M0019]|uniref:hypothetical protein n=1 Tax=unclassified Mesorhizobium TaxID=325217 RepID=UPI00333A4452
MRNHSTIRSGRQIAQHEVQRRDDDERNRDGGGMGTGVGERAREATQQRLDQMHRSAPVAGRSGAREQ